MKRSLMLIALALLLLPVTQVVAQSSSRGRTRVVSYTLSVSASVKGATVSIDGKSQGTAPFQGKLRKGSHEIVVTAKGYKEYQITVDLTKDTKIYAKLVPLTYALTITTNVKKATVLVNKKKAGVTALPPKAAKGTPEQLVLKLRPGSYVITVNAAGYQTFARKVTITKDMVLKAILKPALATIVLPEKYLEGEVKFVKLYVDKKLVSAKMAVKGAIRIPPGKHTVVIASAPVGLRVEREFVFKAGQRYEIKLEMSFVPVQEGNGSESTY